MVFMADAALVMGELQLLDAHTVKGFVSPFHLSISKAAVGISGVLIGSAPFSTHQLPSTAMK